MFLKEVYIKNIRNFTEATVEFKNNVNIFFGNNGQGKTNFIEAIYLIINRRSFRKSENIIQYGKENAEIYADFEIDQILHRIRLEIQKSNKLYTINGKRYKKKFPINTYFINSDVLFYFKNFPHYRRRLIDKLCYKAFGKSFLHTYNIWTDGKINLKKAINSNQLKEKSILYEIEQKYKKEVDKYRLKLIESIKSRYEKIKEHMGLPEVTIKIIRDNRDDISFFRKDKKDLSLGELKSMLFAIFIAVIDFLKEKNNIMLIDDFYSEWDNKRADKILHILRNINIQSFVMTNQNENIADFKIEEGVIYKR